MKTDRASRRNPVKPSCSCFCYESVLGDPRRLPALLALVLLLLTMSACGGGSPGGSPKETLSLVYVNPLATPSIAVGTTLQLEAGGLYQPTPSQAKDLTNSANWSTSDSAVATVNHGLVTGTGSGRVTITATFGGLSASTPVVVGLTPTITITPIVTGTISLSATPKQQFHATATYSDGSTLDLTDFVTWASSPAGVLTFDPFIEGEATFVATGTATITATLSTGELGTITVTVGT